MKPLPRQIDPRKFAQQGIEIVGSVDLSTLTRVKELLFSDKGDVEAELSFDIGEQRILYVAGKIKANVENVCQRCLEAVPVSVNCELNLAIQWEDSDLDRLPSRFEPWIVAEGQADVYQIIEDEILLSLPIVSYHEEECIPHSLFSSGEADTQKVIDAGPSTNPFTALQGLKESLQSSGGLNKKEK
jgi:uncharacterized protein